jgi:hypothetical protein
VAVHRVQQYLLLQQHGLSQQELLAFMLKFMAVAVAVQGLQVQIMVGQAVRVGKEVDMFL